tara:strand:+ start:766 stop:1395 length:630 start_codon:yes stop_codon:yes gene_type:complete
MSEIAIFESAKGEVLVQLEQESVWLNQKQMGELFDKNVRTISEHINNIFKEGELDKDAVIRNFRITAEDGKNYETNHYNLDVIISVGYRVKSQQGTRFRQWATRLLNQHLTKGYTLSQQRFEKNAQELEAELKLIRKAAASPELLNDTGRGLVEIVSRYTQTFLWLQRYDEGLLNEPQGQPGGTLPTFQQATDALKSLLPAMLPSAIVF